MKGLRIFANDSLKGTCPDTINTNIRNGNGPDTINTNGRKGNGPDTNTRKTMNEEAFEVFNNICEKGK